MGGQEICIDTRQGRSTSYYISESEKTNGRRDIEQIEERTAGRIHDHNNTQRRLTTVYTLIANEL